MVKLRCSPGPKAAEQVGVGDASQEGLGPVPHRVPPRAAASQAPQLIAIGCRECTTIPIRAGERDIVGTVLEGAAGGSWKGAAPHGGWDIIGGCTGLRLQRQGECPLARCTMR